jgi:hypothetical protein
MLVAWAAGAAAIAVFGVLSGSLAAMAAEGLEMLSLQRNGA